MNGQQQDRTNKEIGAHIDKMRKKQEIKDK